MSDYVVTVNSTVDLPKEWLAERNVPVIPLKYTIDGETCEDMAGLSSRRIFSETKRRKDGYDITDQPGGSKGGIGAVFKRRKRCTPSGIFFCS